MLWVEIKERESPTLPLLLCIKNSIFSSGRNRSKLEGLWKIQGIYRYTLYLLRLFDLRNLMTKMLGSYQGQILLHGRRLRPKRNCFLGKAGLVSLLFKEKRLSFSSFSSSPFLNFSSTHFSLFFSSFFTLSYFPFPSPLDYPILYFKLE